ncbi:MAG TPA: Xaa-Pro aminopeptidase, partial [Casimicrobiaceae bacterium]|nr:Xaa-Pro aminopeptidase [Casimicrobiaceae bacterium]
MKHAHHHHRERRARLIADMRARSGGGIAAIPTAPAALRNADTHYPYRPDSHFYYLTGFPEPEAVVVLVAGAQAGDSRQILFCRDKNAEREIWDGFRYGPDAALEIFGFDETHSISELASKLNDETCDRPALYTPLGLYPGWDQTVTATLNEVRNRVRTGIAAPEAVVDVRAAIAAMRVVKDAEELSLLRRAAEISSGAHRRAMARTRPGWFEY